MASVTLVESAKLAQDMLVAGVIENIVEVNPMFEVLPFEGISGNAIGYNRENALGDVQVATIGDTITAKNPATFTYVTSSLTTIIGDAEVNGLIQATRGNRGNDQRAVQIASKAKNVGRQYQTMLVNGTGASNQFTGLLLLCSAGQKVTPQTNGQNLDFATLDNLIDLVVAKDGQVDYFCMAARSIRSYYALLRALGGAGVNEVMELPSGRTVPTYRGVPMFRNDFMPVNQTQGAASTCTSVICGTFDDGSMSNGVAGLTAENAAGINVVDVGESETRDESITRVKWYAGLAMFSDKALALAAGVLN